ncbi:hypothetical protein L383_04687 [Enterobacter sp. MGH 37]|nr:hypothetical protein L371_04794 [Enterobacter sp. MGH 25]EUM37201.1 hypothetical protein L383_04687 [Enterobacter sp. MGH 37]
MKMPAFEWVHVQLHQQKGMISLSPPTICNSALTTTGQSQFGFIQRQKLQPLCIIEIRKTIQRFLLSTV